VDKNVVFLGNLGAFNHISFMANIFDKLKQRVSGAPKANSVVVSDSAVSPPPAVEPGADARRDAERKAEEAGQKWRAKAEAKGEIPKEIGGPKGLEPTRYGDWEKAGRCFDF
jgi:hypothetical protein